MSLKKSSLNSDPDILLAQQLFAHGRQTVLPRCAESPRPLNFNVNEMNCIVYSLCVTGTVPSGQCCTWLVGGLATRCSLTCEAVRAPLPVIRMPRACSLPSWVDKCSQQLGSVGWLSPPLLWQIVPLSRSPGSRGDSVVSSS